MKKNLTKSQLGKLERLGKEIYKLFRKVNFNDDELSNKELVKAESDLAKKEIELKKYCLSVDITEDIFYSIQILADLSDGVTMEEYINC